jgi:hypothetical protein
LGCIVRKSIEPGSMRAGRNQTASLADAKAGKNHAQQIIGS